MTHAFRYPELLQPLNPARELPDGLTWFVLITKPTSRRQIMAAHWLEETYGNCMTLTPLETRRRSKGGKGGVTKRINAEFQVPLIPRVVFAGFVSQPNWLAIWHSDEIISNVVGAIGTNGTPLPVRPAEVERFRSSLDADRLRAGLPVLQIGGRALFVGAGPFNGHILEIENLDAKSATVAQEWFGSRRSVRISRDELEPVSHGTYGDRARARA